MKSRVLFALVICCQMASAADTGARYRVEPEDFVALRSVGSPVISPDGRRVVYSISAWEPYPVRNRTSGTPSEQKGKAEFSSKPVKKSHLWLISTDPSARAQPRQITFGENGASSPDWSPDGSLLSFTTSRSFDGTSRLPRTQIWLLPMAGGEAWPLTDAPEGAGSYQWSPDGRHIAYVMQDPMPEDEKRRRDAGDDVELFEQGFRTTHIWVVEVQSKKARQITRGKDFTVLGTPSWSTDGRQLAFMGKSTSLERDPRQDAFIVDITTEVVEKITPEPRADSTPQWSPDGKTLALTVMPQHGRDYPGDYPDRGIYQERLALYDVASGSFKQVDAPFDHEIRLLDQAWSRDGRRILFSSNVGVDTAVFAYDVPRSRFVKIAHDGARRATAIAFSVDRTKVAFVGQSPQAPGDIYIAKSDFSSPRQLTRVNPQVEQWQLANAEVIQWKSSDGLMIEGLLYKPIGYRAGQRYPMAVDIHGGPMFAHTKVFKGDAQFWAGQGWAVLYPNPRGSTYYGEKFLRANLNDWGGGDYRDIMSGVDAVVALGIADPDKLAVMGWSFGGYMTAWIVSQTDRFKAAMMGAGVSDIRSMYGTSDVPNLFSTFFGGYPNEQTLPLYQERSALTYANNVKTPLLIAHGKNDFRVPPSQAMEYYRALKVRNKTVELALYPRAGHHANEYRQQLDRYWRQFRWISRYTLNSGAAAQQKQEQENGNGNAQ